jgi:hypothetical protein
LVAAALPFIYNILRIAGIPALAVISLQIRGALLQVISLPASSSRSAGATGFVSTAGEDICFAFEGYLKRPLFTRPLDWRGMVGKCTMTGG